MSGPIESVARVANTPEQAKVFVATLMAAGIPARIEGENLTDEWAASRRLMNLLGTRVMVPTKCVEQARELLQPVAIDAGELEQQALAAAGETTTLVELETFAPSHGGRGAGVVPWWLLVAIASVGTIAAVLVYGR